MSFRGNLKSFSLTEIFQSLTLNRHTGTLRICCNPDNPESTRFIHFGKGDITFVSPDSQSGFRIGEILSRKGIITTEHIKQALKTQKETGEKIGQILIQQEVVTKEDIVTALTEQIREEIYDLFLLKNAEFEFLINSDPPFHKDPLQKSVKISIDPQPLMVEGIRRLDEWEIISTNIQTFDEIFIPTGLQAEDLEQEESEVYHLIDGKTPVHKLFTKLPFGRFLCARAIFNLATSGLVRTLTFEELVELFNKSKEQDEAIGFLKYALQQKPDETKLRIDLAEYYILQKKDQKAIEVIQTGLSNETSKEDFKELSKVFIKIAPTNPDALRAAIKSAFIDNRLEEAVNYTLSLTDIFKRNNQLQEAKETLTSIEKHQFENPSIRLLIARKWKDLGELKKTVPHLEFLANYYEEVEEWGKLNKILRWLLDADPNRQDARYQLDQIALKLEKKSKRKLHRNIALTIVLIIVGIAIATPIVYQSKAKIAFAAIQNDKLKSMSFSDLNELKASFKNFKRDYKWSPLIKEADNAIKQIKQIQKEFIKKQQANNIKKEQLNAFLKEQPEKLFSEAQKKIQEGAFAEAHVILHRLEKKFPESPQAKAITYPLLLTSIPTNSEVYLQKKEKEDKKTLIGHTPLQISYKPGQELTFYLKYPGCKEKVWNLPKEILWEKNLKLSWSPIAHFSYKKPIYGQMTAANNCLIFSSRDGNLYFLSPFKGKKGWYRPIGLYGDPSSEFTIKNHRIYIGNIDGIFLCIEANTGKTLWQVQLPGAVNKKPFLWKKDTIFTTTRNGYISKLKKTSIMNQKKLTGNILSGPIVIDNILVTGTTSDFCMGFSAENLDPVWEKILDSDVVSGPIAAGPVAIFITQQNVLYAFEPKKGKLLWKVNLPDALSASPLVNKDKIYLPLKNGSIYIFSNSGKLKCREKVSNALLGSLMLTKNNLFFGDNFGKCIAFDLKSKKVKWTYTTPEPIAAQPCLLNNKVLFSTTEGSFFLMEILP